MKETNIGPQPGPQEDFLSSTADIVIYGGAAGGGKTYAILLDFLRHFNNGLAGCVYFRRTYTQIRNEGGLWDTADQLWRQVGATPKEVSSTWIFPSGASAKMAHLQYEKNVYDYQGAQIPVIYFDELTHFTEKQFFYLMSRNRSTSGIKPYMRATTNPDVDSWVRTFIDFWIDEDTGIPIPEHAGVIRYFYRVQGRMYWDDSKENLMSRFPKLAELAEPKSVTFIPSKVTDNQILLKKDPSYMANLLAQNEVERARLLDGNWNIRPTAGNVFKRHYFVEVDAAPANMVEIVRCWDRAATDWNPGDPGDPDWTVGVKLGKCSDGFFWILDIIRERYSAHKVEKLILNTAQQDGIGVKVKGFQDPGAAGKGEIEDFVRMLSGFDVVTEKISVDKVTAAKGASAQAEAGNVRILASCRHKEDFYNEAENFPDSNHDDIVDAFTGSFNELVRRNVGTFVDDMGQYEEMDSLVNFDSMDW